MKEPKTAAELVAELSADPAFLARRREQEQALQQRAVELRKAETPLVEDLRAVGVTVDSVWDLVNTTVPYLAAMPVLLEHLRRPYPERVREGIARALAVPEAKLGWQILLDTFRSESDDTTLGVKWAVGCALGAAADDDVLDDMIALLKDSRHGADRVALLPALARSSNPTARATLVELREDPQLANHVDEILRSIGY